MPDEVLLAFEIPFMSRRMLVMTTGSPLRTLWIFGVITKYATIMDTPTVISTSNDAVTFGETVARFEKLIPMEMMITVSPLKKEALKTAS